MNKEDEYKCKVCKEVWGFAPEDYDFYEKEYPTICPQCSMPMSQMFWDVLKGEGMRKAFRMLSVRLFRKDKL